MFGNKAQMQNMLKKARKMQEDLQKKAGRTEAADRRRLRWRRCYCSHPEWRQTGRFPEDRKRCDRPGRSGNARRPHHHRFQRSQQEGG